MYYISLTLSCSLKTKSFKSLFWNQWNPFLTPQSFTLSVCHAPAALTASVGPFFITLYFSLLRSSRGNSILWFGSFRRAWGEKLQKRRKLKESKQEIKKVRTRGKNNAKSKKENKYSRLFFALFFHFSRGYINSQLLNF